MQARLVLLMGSMTLVGFGCIVQACSSSDDGDGKDAGAEAAVEASAADAAKPECDLDANLLDQIPDAEIADGATTSGACVACLNSKCATQVGQCNALCACKNAAAKGLDCYLKNPSSPTACLVAFTGKGIDLKIQTIGLGLLGCVQSSCKEACATESFNSDAGESDAGEDPQQDGGE